PNSICISCIWWEEKEETYVTSVDTIYLLESLIGVRFTVEEKNRIRRNLEGFRPLTVSKAKADSEEFFKVIMGFPNPKPRNIEKDVKVFPWKILPHALKKIVGKYSASYSSTAGAILMTPVTNGYGSAGPSEAGTEQHLTASPRSATSSAASNVYKSSMTSTVLSPNFQGSARPEISAGPSDMRSSIPNLGVSTQATNQWHSMHQRPVSHQQYSSSTMPSGVGRPSWDYSAFVDASPVTATPGNAQALQYYAEESMPSREQQGHGSEAYQQQYGQRTQP
ncbi:hypothetical protein LTS18_012046, partial [Coniosporium uncinatum]